MSKKYDLPPFLSGDVSPQGYLHWLRRKSSAHVRRDKKRGNTSANNESYKLAIHRAVLGSGGRDDYTGELLDWSLISRYSNAESKIMRRQYKAGFALLPTVDHVGDGLGRADFRICSWRTNDAKHDLTHKEFVELCRRVVAHFDGRPKGSMRTTLTIDDDLADLLKRRARELGLPVKDVVNQTLRAGLGERTKLRRSPAPKTISHSFGFRPGIDLDKVNQLADELEAEAYAAGTWSGRRLRQAAPPPRPRRPRSRV